MSTHIIKSIVIYTDGACSGNPGPGGWGSVLTRGAHRLELMGYEEMTTNNRMELMAAIGALEALKQPCEVQLYSDSSYMVNAFRQNWLGNWQRNGWLTASKKAVENKDLWEKLIKLTNMHKVEFLKVKGHADDEENNRCDYLARMAIKHKGNMLPEEAR